MQKLICVVGQTASGKSDLAVKIAEKFNGEVISADSRQVYRGMDIGTGKITPDTKNSSNFSTGQAKKKYVFTHKGIPHYLLNVASPKRIFTVSQYKNLAEKAIKNILAKGKMPIICGGTGFYIQTLVDDLQIPKVAPDWKLRKKLEEKNTTQLFKMLKKLDPRRAKTIDAKNPRRLIRAIEIVMKTGKSVPKLKINPRFDALFIGIKKSPEELKKRIKKRLLKRLKIGMTAEVKRLRKSGLSWKRLEGFGLEYRWIAKYLQKKILYSEMIKKLQKDIENYAKRQMTWFSAHGGSASGGKRDKKIHWIKNYKDTEKIVKNFLTKRP